METFKNQDRALRGGLAGQSGRVEFAEVPGLLRRRVVSSLMGSVLGSWLALPRAAPAASQAASQQDHLPIPKIGGDDVRLPNGKLQRDEIARQQHADALKDADALVAASEELREELKQAGDYVVPVVSLKKTEEIEKLARKIRGRLKN